MINLFDKNGLLFQEEKDIVQRDNYKNLFVQEIKEFLIGINPAFHFFQIESNLMMPIDMVGEYKDIYKLSDNLCLRPETTIGSYKYAKHLLNPHLSKIKPPFVVWQIGKSFRREQDDEIKSMRLKEFYQMEFQILYPHTTKNDYYSLVTEFVKGLFKKYLGECELIPSDRLPEYSEKTMDIMYKGMEICSMSLRKDFELKNVEIAIGMDRLIYSLNHQ